MSCEKDFKTKVTTCRLTVLKDAKFCGSIVDCDGNTLSLQGATGPTGPSGGGGGSTTTPGNLIAHDSLFQINFPGDPDPVTIVLDTVALLDGWTEDATPGVYVPENAGVYRLSFFTGTFLPPASSGIFTLQFNVDGSPINDAITTFSTGGGVPSAGFALETLAVLPAGARVSVEAFFSVAGGLGFENLNLSINRVS